MKKYKVTLTFDIAIEDLPTDIGLRLNSILRDWDEGRYPFCVEQIQGGALEALNQALFHSAQDAAKFHFGNEMVTTGENSQTARWYLEALKAYESHDKPCISSEIWAWIESVE